MCNVGTLEVPLAKSLVKTVRISIFIMNGVTVCIIRLVEDMHKLYCRLFD